MICIFLLFILQLQQSITLTVSITFPCPGKIEVASYSKALRYLSVSNFTYWIQLACDREGSVMLKPYETINGALLLFSVTATAKHYATCQLIHSSHLIDRYIVTWFDK
jgi:hypothetical protein